MNWTKTAARGDEKHLSFNLVRLILEILRYVSGDFNEKASCSYMSIGTSTCIYETQKIIFTVTGSQAKYYLELWFQERNTTQDALG